MISKIGERSSRENFLNRFLSEQMSAVGWNADARASQASHQPIPASVVPARSAARQKVGLAGAALDPARNLLNANG
jgi:hypothetical protein